MRGYHDKMDDLLGTVRRYHIWAMHSSRKDCMEGTEVYKSVFAHIVDTYHLFRIFRGTSGTSRTLITYQPLLRVGSPPKIGGSV